MDMDSLKSIDNRIAIMQSQCDDIMSAMIVCEALYNDKLYNALHSQLHSLHQYSERLGVFRAQLEETITDPEGKLVRAEPIDEEYHE